jgi:uncharacterized protein (DUF433 family)
MAARKKPIVHSDPGIMGGEVVFVGTRVPLKTLFDYIEGGDTLDRFLEDFPTVKKAQAFAAIQYAHQALATSAHSA